MRAGFVSQGNKRSMASLIADDTAIATGYQVINLCIVLFGTTMSEGMKCVSLLYRWCWGGVV